MTKLISCLVLAFFFVPIPGQSQWSTDPAVNTVFQSSGNDDTNELTVPDGSGGSILIYSTTNDGGFTIQLFAKRVKADGTLAWGTSSGGILLCDAPNDRYITAGIPDGTGGVIVSWVDYRTSPPGTDSRGDIYIQRINGNGDVLWGSNGLPVATEASVDEFDCELVTDGAGGAIVGWSWNNRTSNAQASIQRYNAAGVALWPAGGVQLMTVAGFRFLASMIADGQGGAIAVLVDYRNDDSVKNIYNNYDPVAGTVNSDIYAQRISSAGARQWGEGGAVVCNAPKNQGDYQPGSNAVALPDGSNGAFIFFSDYRNDPFQDGYPIWQDYADIYMQRLDASGNRLLNAAGVKLVDIARDQYLANVVRTSTGNYCVAYYDATPSVSKVVGQLVNGSGSLLWASPVSLNGNSKKDYTALLADGSGNVISAYVNDLQNNTATTILAQKFDAAGVAQWGQPVKAPVSICTNTSSGPVFPMILPSEAETMILTWTDFRNNASLKADIFGSKLSPNGTLTNWAGGPIISAAPGFWDASTTWQSGILPVAGSEVVIRHQVTLRGNASAKKVTVEPAGGNLRINNGFSLTVSQ